ncbi:hypothetical protein NEOLEDRAFT_1153437 [Neolentinus lepideus HHB14362 ss-1]|uniref:Nucleotidyltransferase n=1 Tax=Neolentinus lepideus HHB14362 ss-1 TaxID=1314782 RepID=A0A165VRD9_9AGAM|nr:hypothetical protein NEOLEDRAFT_1153437 [Neolentinus lepideus HHB14362 ss-1]
MLRSTARRNPPTLEETRAVARTATRILTSHGLTCCAFGSLACNLYGTLRTPNDIDLVVMTRSYTQEELKDLIRRSDSRFYLVPSRKPFATYKVFYYRLAGYRRSCKVDILLPGIMNIPTITSGRIVKVHDIPVMPLSALLLLKLQGWSDHRASTRPDMIEKQYVDVQDINQLLRIASTRGLWMQSETWLPSDFLEAAGDRIAEYVDEYPSSGASWEAIGYDMN